MCEFNRNRAPLNGNYNIFGKNNMNEINSKLISLMVCAMHGKDGRGALAKDVSEAEIAKLYVTAKKHDLAHLVGVALEAAAGSDKQRYKLFFQESIKAMYRYERMKAEQEKICAILERRSIPYIPLKGAVIRTLYREPWHRTSCDIDILVPEEHLKDALAVIEADLSYVRGKRSRHDVSLTAPNGVHLELHFDIDEKYVDCAELWNDAQPVSQGSCRYALGAEMLILTHIAHMAKHFLNGGCGLRPILDLWLMKEKLVCNREKLLQMLDSHGLAEFGRAVFGVAEVWFDGKKPNKTELLVEAYILQGGVYGSTENKVAVQQVKKQSKKAYFLDRIFQPYEAMRYPYPILDKHRWMLPLCQIHRWWKLLFCGKAKKVFRELRIGVQTNDQKKSEVSALLRELQLGEG